MENNESVKHDDCGCGCGCSSSEAGNNEVQTEKCSSERAKRSVYAPSVDIVDSTEETVLVVDLPGVDEAGVDIEIEKNILTIKASQTESRFADYKLVHGEYGVGEYKRGFSLPENIDRDGISAKLQDGVLRIRLPKSAPEAKKIHVSAS